MRPPAMARSVICAHAGFMPQMKSAGMVKSTPDATDDEADPTVWEMLDSRMECFSPAAVNARNTTTVSTATGMEVLMVSPARSPR